MRHFINRLKRGLKWFRRGYNTQEWDWVYLLDIIRFKLEDMREFWSDPDNVHIIEKSRLRNLKQISICAFLMKRLAEDQYESEHIHKPLEAKWGKLQMIDKKILTNGLMVPVIRHEKATSYREYKKTRKELSRLLKKSGKIREYDMELFCRIFSKHYRSWYD